MRKEIISVFSCFAKDETKFFSYSNLHSKMYSGSVLAKFSQNTCGRKCETQIHENDLKILEVWNQPLYKNNRIFCIFLKITYYNCHCQSQKWPFLFSKQLKMAFFGPIWTQFRSKQLKIWPESHWIDRIDRIDQVYPIRNGFLAKF